MESLARMMFTTQVNPAKQLIVTKLVLREVEVRTPGRAGTGGVFEHPAKDKLDYGNPIVTIIDGTNAHLNFRSKNGDTTPIKSN